MTSKNTSLNIEKALLYYLDELGYKTDKVGHVNVGKYVMQIGLYDTLITVFIVHSPVCELIKYKWATSPTLRTDIGLTFFFSIYSDGTECLLKFLQFAKLNTGIPLFMLNKQGELDSEVEVMYASQSSPYCTSWGTIKRTLKKYAPWL